MKFLNSKTLSALLGILTLWLFFSTLNLHSQRNIVERQLQDARAKIADVERDTAYLDKFLAYFQTPAFLEKEARLKLNYKTPGEEVVFVYKDTNNKKASVVLSFDELLARIPNYKKWFLYLLGY